MPSSSSSSVVVISDTDTNSNDDDDASDALSRPAAERIASTLRTQAAVDALCRKHSVPREFLASPAGELRACGTPPPGAVCVYAHALETGVRFPLHAFFCDALTHFGLAPGQFSLNGWRVLVGFVALCHEAGVRPSLVLFRHFFKLYNRNGWCYTRCRVAAGVLFTGLNYTKSEREWKGGFFFCDVLAHFGIAPTQLAPNECLGYHAQVSATRAEYWMHRAHSAGVRSRAHCASTRTVLFFF